MADIPDTDRPQKPAQARGKPQARPGGKGRGCAQNKKGDGPNRARPAQGGQPPAAEAAPKPVLPPASKAHLKPRHWGLLASFVLIVILPVALIAVYLYFFAVDQYASEAGFTVRSEEGGAATDILGGLQQITGGTTSVDADILFEFITSQEMVQRLNEDIDLAAHYSQFNEVDPIFSLQDDASIEDVVDHWQRVVRVSFDQSGGLIELQVLAFDPRTAQSLAMGIVRVSQSLINELNGQARADSMRFAQADLDTAIERLRNAREALTDFRIRTQIVDPESDMQGRLGVLNTLQQQLAEALIEFDLLSETTSNPSDPRLVQVSRRIAVIRERIAEERQTFALDETGPGGEDYPTLMAEFEGLVVDREFAEESYRAARTAVDVTRTNAARQSRYLAVFIQPTLPESAEFPRKTTILGLSFLFLGLGWAILAIIFYSIRDRQ